MTNKPSHLWLDLFACFLIPAYTLLFAGSTAWFGTNFSVIAVLGPDHYRGFIYWGVLAGGYFLVMLNALAAVLPGWRAGLAVRLLAAAACLCLAYALAIPYLPEYFPKYAALHVLLAASACVLLMLITLGCGALFLIPRMVSTALEVFFTISAALLARRMWLLAKAQEPPGGAKGGPHGKI